MAHWRHLPFIVGAMKQDGIYVSEKTYEDVMQCKALFVDDGLILVESAPIFVEKDIPDGYMVFLSGGEVTTVRTFTVED